jgi:phage terminase large subunit GpA-like protein
MKSKRKVKWSPVQVRTLHVLHRRVAQLWNPPPCLPIWEWAELRRRLGRNVTAKPGRYQIATAPYQKEPQESFTDPEVQVTVLYMGKRLGKTEMAMNLIGATIEQNPRNILVTYPTIDSAKKWSKQFFEPMRKSTVVLRKKIKDSKSRDSGNTILAKEYPGGTISAIGANSPSGFRQVQAPVVFCDEVDESSYDTVEGDGVELAFGRAENYPDNIQVLSSTATKLFRVPKAGDVEAGKTTGSRIHDWWLKSDQRKWHVKNLCCGKFHVLDWKNIKWPEGHKHEQTWYECPDCHAHWDDKMRVEAICAGQWRATALFKGIRGYWLNGLNTTFSHKKGFKSKLHQMASEFYRAYTSGEKAMIVWKNTFLCEPHIEEAEQVDPDPFYNRLEDYHPTELPEDICLIFLVCDVQADRIEYEFIGLGENEETWGIESGKIQGDPERDAVWDDLKTRLHRTFKRLDGAEMKVDCFACDHGHKGNRVRAFIKKCGHPRAYAVHGASNKQGLLVIPHKNKKYRITLYSVGTDNAKDILFARMKLKTPGARYMHYPIGHGYEKKRDGYFEQLTAEEVRLTPKRGWLERHYEKVRERNEALDIRVYFLAAVDILNPVVSVIKKEIKKKLGITETKQIEYVIKKAADVVEAMPDPHKPAEPEKPAEMVPRKRKRFSMRGGRPG